MFCNKCGKQLPDNAKFCNACSTVHNEGSDSADSTENTTCKTESNINANNRNGLRCLILLIILSVGIGGFFAFRQYSYYSTYNSAMLKFDFGDYEEARALFASIENYKDSSTYAKECLYRQAIVEKTNGNYDKAISVFETLMSYKDSKQYIKECKYNKGISEYHAGNYDTALSLFESVGDFKDAKSFTEKTLYARKYAAFVTKSPDADSLVGDWYSVDGIMWYYDDIRESFVKTPERVEELIDENYCMWYSYDTNKTIDVTKYTINGSYYGINYVQLYQNDGYSCEFYYLDEPDNIYAMSVDYEWFDYIGENLQILYIYNEKTNQTDIYHSIPQNIYEEYERMSKSMYNSNWQHLGNR